MKPFALARPETVTEATRLLRDGAQALAGGTDLIPLMKDGVAEPARLVDLTGLSDLRGWKRTAGKGLRIGALTSLVELETSPSFAKALPLVAESLTDAATLQLRTMATVGGCLLQRTRCWYFRDEAFPCWLKGGTECFAAEGESQYHAILGAKECVSASPGDLAPALIACDAEIEIRGIRSRRMKLADLYVFPSAKIRAEHSLRDGELIVAVHVPEAALKRTGTYLKTMDRRGWSFGLVSVAVTARIQRGKASEVRIVLGGVAPVPWRAKDAEAAVEGSALDERSCGLAADAAVADAMPLKDNGYKVTLARELVRRGLRSLVAR